MNKTCETCQIEITGATQRRFCSPCRKSRHRATTRYLLSGEAIPDHEPKRYPSSHGYIRLRWKVAPYTYVETYEHRVFGGFVTTEEHVHHVNRNRADNRPENLVPLAAEKHRLEHSNLSWHEDARALYISGLSTYKVAKIVGRDPANVWRALKKMGVSTRSEERIAVPYRESSY